VGARLPRGRRGRKRSSSYAGPGDYVIFKGTLFEDFAHGDADGGAGEWDFPGMVGHGGWMEVHPVD